MTRHRRGSLPVAAVLFMVMAVTVAACGATTTANTTTQSLVNTVQSRGTLIIGVAPNKPNLYQEGASGQWTGFFMDFANYWAKFLNVKVQVVPTTFGEMVAGIQADKFDLAMDLNQRPARSLAVNFTEGLVTELGVFVFDPAKVPVTSWEQLNNSQYSACVPQGAAEDLGLTAQSPALQITRLPQDTACYAALVSGKVSATFSNWAGAAQFAHDNPGYKLLFPPRAFVNEPEAIAINKKYGYGDVQALNIAIDNFIKEGGVAKAEVAAGLVNPIPYAIPPVPAYAQQAAGNQFGG